MSETSGGCDSIGFGTLLLELSAGCKPSLVEIQKIHNFVCTLCLPSVNIYSVRQSDCKQQARPQAQEARLLQQLQLSWGMLKLLLGQAGKCVSGKRLLPNRDSKSCQLIRAPRTGLHTTPPTQRTNAAQGVTQLQADAKLHLLLRQILSCEH